MHNSTPDPRDAVSEAADALCCLMLLASQAQDDLPCTRIASALRLILDRLEPAADALHDYVPRGVKSST